MTDVASILACYRSGQISEAEMVDICREWLEVEAALRETSITEREESATETPPAEEILPNGKNEETAIMQFDLHSDLANQITIENLKWHLANLRDSDWSTMHSEDVTNYGETMAALIEVLGYFGDKQ